MHLDHHADWAAYRAACAEYEDRRDRPGPWTVAGDGWELRWQPTPPYLDGTSRVVADVTAWLEERELVPATPTGPVVDATLAEPLAVWSSMLAVARPWWTTATGRTPMVPPLPPGAVG